jgi:uncharacterized peroxidase-related enzyme
MSRLASIDPSAATGDTARAFAKVKAAYGGVPNAYATVGTNAPDVLEQLLAASSVVKASSLSPAEIEAINLTVSEATGCDYCLAAHSLIAKKAGLNSAQTLAARRGTYPDDSKIDTLVRFVNQLVRTQGTLDGSEVDALRAAGYSDAAIVETAFAVSTILFTNMINRINDTTLDFPKAQSL